MTPTECVAVTRLVKAVCPAQVFDEFTADTWCDLLADVRLADAQEAVKRLGQRQRFIAPSEIRDEVDAIRSERLDRYSDDRWWTPPPEIADSPKFFEWLREARQRVADGGEPPVRELPSGPHRGDVPALVGGTFRKPPSR